jgi:murein DD-endopeptidase MepM/ murein hydrolase activator NlpD
LVADDYSPFNRNRKRRTIVLIGLVALVIAIGVIAFLRSRAGEVPTTAETISDTAKWLSDDEEARRELITSETEPCPGAPFLLPAEGWIGLLYADPRGPYSENHRHQGIDIFSPTEPGLTPVYAAYDGYLTREEYWTSAVIIRVPDDPLHPGRQIWLYYTHMADRSGSPDFIDDAFPPGTHEVFVTQGTLLGYTGDYSGSARTIWTHLHFSIVRDDGFGNYTNELEFDNTIDPSLYLGLAVNVACAPSAPYCTTTPICEEAILSASGS